MAQQPPPWNWNVRNRMPSEDYRVNVKQLRPRRQPLYLPAALRPSDLQLGRDIPNHPRLPDTPPASQGNSFDSSNPNSQFLETGALPLDGQNEELDQLGRGLSNVALGEGLDEDLDEVTGEPTTAHWKPDATAKACAVCHVPFTWYFRRHHCRCCGHVVCGNHLKHKVPLDQNARFHPKGQESKACPRCHEQWKAKKKLRDSRASSVAESQTNAPEATLAAVTVQQQRPHPSEEQHVGSFATSTGLHSWSTF